MPQAARAISTQSQDLAAHLRAVIGGISRKLRERSRLGDLTTPQVSVLLRLEREGPSTVSALARAEGIRPQSLGEAVAGLRAGGLVQAKPHPTDGRQVVLALTELARHRASASRAARQDWLFEVLEARFTAQERRTLGEAVVLLNRFLEGQGRALPDDGGATVTTPTKRDMGR